jgi:hypothetical protein
MELIKNVFKIIAQIKLKLAKLIPNVNQPLTNAKPNVEQAQIAGKDASLTREIKLLIT